MTKYETKKPFYHSIKKDSKCNDITQFHLDLIEGGDCVVVAVGLFVVMLNLCEEVTEEDLIHANCDAHGMINVCVDGDSSSHLGEVVCRFP